MDAISCVSIGVRKNDRRRATQSSPRLHFACCLAPRPPAAVAVVREAAVAGVVIGEEVEKGEEGRDAVEAKESAKESAEPAWRC